MPKTWSREPKLVLEVEARDVLARCGEWRGPSGPPVGVPLLLVTGGPKAARPGEGQLLPAASAPTDLDAPVDGVLFVADMGSAMAPAATRPTWAHLVVPPEHPLPPSLADQLDDVPLVAFEDGATVEVVHGAAPGMAREAAPAEGVEWVVLASAASLAGDPWRLVDAVMAARRRAGPGRLLYLPGAATPSNLALLAYMGADVVDDIQARLAAAMDREARTTLGHLPLGRTPHGSPLEAENLAAMRAELELVRHAVAHGSLRELVEARVRSEPWQVAALRRLDREHAPTLLGRCPVHREAPLLSVSREGLYRVEVTDWVLRLEERYAPPPSARVLLLLPCSARKPYSLSRTHRSFDQVLSGVGNRATVHEVVLTSPLGAVPRELERTYPASNYDIPVSGEWFPDELERMRALAAFLRAAGGYGTVISHMGDGLPFLWDDPSVVQTREAGEGPTARSALRRLGEEVSEAASEAPRSSWPKRRREDLAALASFQFGADVARALMEDGAVEGRPPGLRLKGPEGRQRGMVVPARGLVSLTLEGAARVAAAGSSRVWMDDFELRGDLFAVGVIGVDEGLRPGEEAIVMRDDRVAAVGVARMAAEEMMALSRGVAVAVRHRATGGGEG